MRTIVLSEPGRFSRTETEPPGPPSPGQARVRVRRIGVCGTDLHAFRGRQPFFTYPRILGHELGVEILDIGPNPAGLQIGDTCAVEPYLNCENCIACRRGKPNCCVRLQVLGVHTDGGMRDEILVPVNKLHRSARLTLDQLALVETLCIGAHAVQRATLEPGEQVLVVGAGPIGLSVMQFAQAAGAKVTVLDVSRSRLDFCASQLGIQQTILAGEDVVAQVTAAGGGELPTAVFDATGNAGSMHRSFSLAAHGGRIVFVGLFLGDVTFHDPDFHRRELTLLATRNATSEDFRRVIGLLESGAVDTTPWITHRADLDGMIREFPSWLEPDRGVVKAVIEL